MPDDHDPQKKSAMDAAVRMLTLRNHTRRELEAKLARKGFSREAAAEAVATCQRLDYLDDRRLARFYVEELRSKGYGPRFVQKAMRTKGFDTQLIASTLAKAGGEDEELETARRALEKKQRTFAREKDPRRRREKIYRYLYSRGFSASVISVLTRR